MAEDARFELALRFWRKFAFQANGFSHSPNPPIEIVLVVTFSKKKRQVLIYNRLRIVASLFGYFLVIITKKISPGRAIRAQV